MQEKLKAQQEKVQRDLATALNQRVFLDLWIKDLTFFTNRNIIEIEKVARADPFEPAHLAASFDVASD